MKHDLEAFTRDIVSLIKTSGDTGDSGDKSKKSLQHSDNFVPTASAVVSPLDLQWGQHVSASGDRKAEYSQPLESSVPTVPTVATHFQRGRAGAKGGFPPEWHAFLEQLRKCEAVDWLSDQRWSEVISDADNFLSRWGDAAKSLGWTLLDLLGVHPTAPAARVGMMGLILFVHSGAVVALTAGSATIRRPSQAILIYRRHDTTGAVLISEATP